MKLQDKETLSIAKAVKDVLEKKIVKEITYPHKMYSPDGEQVTANNKEEHEKYSAKGYSHSKPVKEVDEPRAKGEKEFKAKHAVKKSGMKPDGTVTKESVQIDEKLKLSAADYKKAQAIVNNPKTKGGDMTQAIKDLEKWKKGSSEDKKVEDMLRIAHEGVDEPRAKGEKEFKAKHFAKKSGMNTDGTNVKEGTITTSVDVSDYPVEKQAKKLGLKVKIKKGAGDGTYGPDLATFTGPDAKIIKYFVDYMGFEGGTLKDLQKEFESVQSEKELSPKQKKYQAFFQKALKKFGVKSPAELDGDKKKEFFDYVDKNYDAGEGEEDEQEIKKEVYKGVYLSITVPYTLTKNPDLPNDKFPDVYLDKWDKKNGTITVQADDRDLLNWLTKDKAIGLDKKKAQDIIKKGKKESVSEAYKEVEVPWDQDNPKYYADAFADEFSVYLNKWNKKGGFISLEGDEKDLLKLFMSPDHFEMDKKEALSWIKKGKKVKEEVTVSIDTSILEAKKPGKGKTTQDIDYIGDKAHAKQAEKKHKIKIKVTGRSSADITGEKKAVIAYLKDPDLYGMDDSDIEDIYPDLYT